MDERKKRLVKAVAPPVVLDATRRFRRPRTPPEWQYVPEGWSVGDRCRGWDVEGVVAAARAKLPALRAALAGPGLLGTGTEAAIPVGAASVTAHNEILVLAYSLTLASRATDECSVLDWGGGLGFSALVARAVLPPEVTLDYQCKEHSLLCEAGRELVPEARFRVDDACLDDTYDLVLASSSLQYAEDWEYLVGRFAGAARRYVLLTRVPIVLCSASFVVLQRVPAYGTEYLGWVFNRDEVLDVAERAGLHLVREFLLGFRPPVAGAPEQDETRAFLFRVSSSPQDG